MSGDETSTGGDQNETLNLPSTSTTIASNDEEADSGHQKSKGCGKSGKQDGERPNFKKCTCKSLTSKIVSLEESEDTRVIRKGAEIVSVEESKDT